MFYVYPLSVYPRFRLSVAAKDKLTPLVCENGREHMVNLILILILFLIYACEQIPEATCIKR